jgi:hypothetical protein
VADEVVWRWVKILPPPPRIVSPVIVDPFTLTVDDPMKGARSECDVNVAEAEANAVKGPKGRVPPARSRVYISAADEVGIKLPTELPAGSWRSVSTNTVSLNVCALADKLVTLPFVFSDVLADRLTLLSVPKAGLN